jgi:CheY-like chemotaxis protein
MEKYGLIPLKGTARHFISAYLPHAGDDPAGSRHPIEILLVEDNPADVRMMQEALLMAEIPHHLALVTDGEEALQYLNRQGKYSAATRPDIVLLDIKLPKISGHGVLEAIRNNPELRTLPVMILTSSSAPQDRATSEDLQATHFITKPVGLNVLAGDIKIINALVKRSGV